MFVYLSVVVVVVVYLFVRYCAPLNKVYLYDCQQISRSGIERLKVSFVVVVVVVVVLLFCYCYCLQSALPDLKVQAYFAPLLNPPLPAQTRRSRLFSGCRNCVLL